MKASLPLLELPRNSIWIANALDNSICNVLTIPVIKSIMGRITMQMDLDTNLSLIGSILLGHSWKYSMCLFPASLLE